MGRGSLVSSFLSLLALQSIWVLKEYNGGSVGCGKGFVGSDSYTNLPNFQNLRYSDMCVYIYIHTHTYLYTQTNTKSNINLTSYEGENKVTRSHFCCKSDLGGSENRGP